jgi:hypothetical protein
VLVLFLADHFAMAHDESFLSQTISCTLRFTTKDFVARAKLLHAVSVYRLDGDFFSRTFRVEGPHEQRDLAP